MEKKDKDEGQGKHAGVLRSPSLAAGYAVALLLSGLAAAIDLLFPNFSLKSPFSSFYLSTGIAAWFGGFRAGLLATAAAIALVEYYFLPTRGFSTDPDGLIRIILVGFTMVVFSWLIDNRSRARQRIEIEHERAESQQRRFQATLSSAARIAGLGSWEHDIANDRLEWDDETLRIFGIARENFGGNAAAFFALVHPEDREALKAMQVKARPSHGTTEMEYRIVRPDGAVRNIHDRGQVTRYEAGEPVQSTGMVMDVTEQRQAEESLRVQAHILDNIGQAVIATDIEARITYANRHAGEVYGWSVSEMLGQNAMEILVPQPSREQAERIMAGLHHGENWSGEFVSQRRDRSVFPAFVTSAHLTDKNGKLTGVVGISTDITERKRSQEELQASEDRWRAIFENSAVGIALADARGTFTLTNRAYQKMVGYTDEELRSMSYVDLTYEEDRAANADMAKQLWQGKLQQFQHEKRYRRKDGKLIWVRNTVSIAPKTEITPRFAMAIVEDVTERRSLEEQVRQSQRMEAVGRLAGGVAHDFNNMLGVILGHCLSLQERLPAGNPEWQSVEQIKKASTRSADLTRQLLAFSRKQILMPRVLDLNATVADLSSMLDSLIGDDVDLVIHPGKKLGYVKADLGQIGQVLMNLVVNARDAMPQGGQVVIATENVILNGRPATANVPGISGPYIMLSVSDNGCGIEADTQSHIFEPFFTTKEQGHGTGLGLATVYGIVKQSDGSIVVESQPGKGTAFKIYLPQAEGEIETTAVEREESSADGGDETILLAEDEPMLCEIVRFQLEKAGYTVLEAHDGKEALVVAQNHTGKIDLLLTDVLMTGGTNGLELAAHIGPTRPELKVLYMTGYTADVIDAKGVANVQDKVLQKPFTAVSLRNKIREVLSAK
jgi:two-component system, cell cycle sensor histidine kinase and response regulator CckA